MKQAFFNEILACQGEFRDHTKKCSLEHFYTQTTNRSNITLSYRKHRSSDSSKSVSLPSFLFLYSKVCSKYFERPDIQVRGNNQVANSSLTVKLPINSTISVYDLWNVSLLGIQNKFIILKSNK